MTVVLGFGLWLRLSGTAGTVVDERWLHLVGLDVGSVPYWIAVTLAEVGGANGAMICTGLAAALLVLLRRFRAAVVPVTTMLLGVALSEIIKALVMRPRPHDQLYDSLGFSYPSGHAMGATALAMSLALIATRAHMDRSADPTRWRFRWPFALAAVWILAMMWSRTALQVHWLTDTIAGVLLGLTVVVLADAFWTVIAARTRLPALRR